jgi:octaheme c-type cytochrome (tetrathionate reductase family)
MFVMIIPAAGLAAYDHSQIEGRFDSGPAVTKQCLQCHEDQAENIMETSHWTWIVDQEVPGKGRIERGKKNVVNNFCISVSSNWPRCTSCHIGYGWKDDSFDFTDKTKVDCLVCHDTTGTYKKIPTGGGLPVEKVDLLNIARNVGEPSRKTCGACHFYGGGGDRVKHGDLDSSLVEPPESLDVHMSRDGEDMTCQDCHETNDHMVKGNALVVSPSDYNHLGCEQCHGEDPHNESRLNDHAARIACQTCHIPSFAREFPTKVYWDWSTAGEERDPESNEYGMPTHHKKKGSFRWQKDIVPTYAWYNGQAGVYTLGDKIKPEKVNALSWPIGSRKDKDSKIYPFKIMEGRQIYDSKNNILIVPKLFGKGGYWATYEWNQAAKLGMESVGFPYSGEYGWIETAMYWKINHMVAPKEDSLGCLDCHGSEGRLDWKALGYKKEPMN